MHSQPAMAQTNASAGASTAAMPGKYKKREEKDFSVDEKKYLDELKKHPLLKKLRLSRIYEGPFQQLRNWLHFFDSTDPTSGVELQHGLAFLWSTFIVVETLLAGIAMQPFTNPQGLEGWKRTWYGMLWMWALLSDFLGLGTTTLFLGYLFGDPGKLTWAWACKIGVLRGIPAILILWATLLSLVAIGYTSFILYGKSVGIVCAVVEGMIIAAGFFCSKSLARSRDQVCDREL